jgi:hypothetical protein
VEDESHAPDLLRDYAQEKQAKISASSPSTELAGATG